MAPDTPDVTTRVDSIRQLWSDGDYARVGALFAPVTDAVVDELDLEGRAVLDAATGTGNTALAAARAGARVSAFDLTPRLLDVARERAESAGLDIDFVDGDLLEVPYPDDSFDVVLSTFGAFTADDPHRCAAELVRVCRPGGTVVSTAWGREGIFGEITEVVADLHPAILPPGRPDPRAWAEEAGLAAIFDGLDVDIRLTHRTAWFPFPSTAAALELFEEVSGPVQRLRTAVTDATDDGWVAVRGELLRRWERLSRPHTGGVELSATFGIAEIAVR